jgi:hypothetical protein
VNRVIPSADFSQIFYGLAAKKSFVEMVRTMESKRHKENKR